MQQKPQNGDSDKELVEAFVRALQEATSFKVAPERHFAVSFQALEGTQRLDALLALEDVAPPVWLAIEILRQGYPRDIKNALWRLDEYARTLSPEKNVLPVVLAQHLSPGARHLLRGRNVAFYDAGDSLFLRHGTVVVDIERRAAPPPRSRPLSLFSGAREQVVHALLHSEGAWITGKDLALQAQTSAFTVSRTLSELERMEWVQAEGGGRTARRRLLQPAQLLDAWAEAWKARKEARSRWFFFASNPRLLPDTVAQALQSAGFEDWAITGAAAGNALAPLLTAVDTVDLIVPAGSAARLAEAAGAKRADQGANLTFIERSGASGLFRRPDPDHPDTPLASPYVIYLDLLKDDRGRNKELAAQLRSTLLKI
ncbi:type IV toxin-antitoxin system AbiEi family antitoxin [Variovorax sp. J22R133]|uniref:type IV toxin-antitoxin system AbiEi family antitoxin n=1 Tax=Variovorax brevis TaxID=3053503 RepID=UPI0025749FB6|nr:type IV toxin-antitoxin system AbiEi family antitoxin [Variovorax sp. J22R133]MDM0111637.1 type IV toxin-antitoxin system AbiEi family antitoxin [Variovorax sp. J22R133]